MKSRLLFLCLGIFLCASRASFAADLTGEAIAEKCYLKLTRQRQPNFRKYKDYDKARAISYCRSLVDAVGDGGDGRAFSKNENLLSQGEAKMVAQTLYDFHRNWFKSTNWTAAVPGDSATTAASIHDTYLPAGFITRAFLEDRSYESVLNGTGQPYTLRRDGVPYSDSDGGPNQREGCNQVQGSNGGGANNFRVTGIATGQFDGFRDDNRGRSMRSCSDDWEVKVGESLGGGLLGAISYLELNMGFSPFVAPFADTSAPIVQGSTSNGGLRVARRWSKAVFNELLCRDLPAMRTDDVKGLVQSGANYPTFRQGASCLTCHNFMDPMAGTIRNLVIWNMGNDGTYIARFKGAMQSTADERPAADSDFHKRPPTGKLIFRSITGDLVQTPVSGLDELGTAISKTIDFYACASSRYLSFFAGVNIPLADPNGVKDSAEMVFLKGLASDFQKSQNIKSVIKAIFGSTYFTTSNRGN